MESRLSPLQVRVLGLVGGLGCTLTGGGALVGFYLGHRETRDLDLFLHDARTLGTFPREVEARLVGAGLSAERLQTAETFVRLRVSDGDEVLPVDLVADPVPVIEPPVELLPGLLVDTRHEILVNKLTALLSRWAVRDLVDVRALLDAGGDLSRALSDAPRKDGGFSAQTLAWVLDSTPAPLPPDLVEFRAALVHRLLA